ncbi:TPA: hypothetical protein MIX95_22240 [Klebsiella pneumoniae]|nr:hypothetical protein [Klebsiella pneumoniae]HBY4782932.1 hypothetical protein [Klebsiella pneumoniae]HBY5555988.1 hypothetical protein [Klebsiella pneumoniae]
MFAGKKSAQIREILISESAWEEMTCLFAPSLALFLFFCRSGLSRASDTSGAGDGFLMRVSAWEAPCAGDPRSEARTKKALRLQP